MPGNDVLWPNGFSVAVALGPFHILHADQMVPVFGTNQDTYTYSHNGDVVTVITVNWTDTTKTTLAEVLRTSS